jgi:hypothetical protein
LVCGRNSSPGAQPASYQPQRPSPRLREPFPSLRGPDLICAPRPRATRRNARRRLRRPVRCSRQLRHCPT